MAWTSPADVLGRWLGGGEPSLTDPKLAEFIEDAEEDIRHAFPEIQTRIDSGDLSLRRVQKVVARVVTRAYKVAYNPLASFSRGAGEYSESGTYDNEGRKYLSLTDKDLEDLAPPAPPSYFTVDMNRSNHASASPYGGAWHLIRKTDINGTPL